MTAADRWTAELQGWAIPEPILAAAPRNPYEFPASVIRKAAVDPLGSPTGAAVRERLSPGERLLDVGCGAGRIAGAFTADHEVLGVEPRPALAEESRALGITVFEDRWPDAAARVGTEPVALCTHVLYDVQDPRPFLAALHAAAGRRVVLEVTAAHPWAWIGPLYRLVHGIERPSGPTADLLAEVVAEVVGTSPSLERWTRPGSTYDSTEAMLDHTNRMLCIGPDHPLAGQAADTALAGVTRLDDGSVRMPDVDQVTLWWDT